MGEVLEVVPEAQWTVVLGAMRVTMKAAVGMSGSGVREQRLGDEQEGGQGRSWHPTPPQTDSH